ncbi:MAG: hypothetical protein KME35_11490 [Aphanocapsa sp. GSE-SYN-MK-11-07L]|jgi:hypothetical protein|nr:hypothetical protein [Aphanocapsa sp. GSE-SYN-MK-11-07L]
MKLPHLFLLSGSLTALLAIAAAPIGLTRLAPAALANPPDQIAQAPTAQLPPKLAQIIRQDLAQKTNLAIAKLKIISASRQTWPNGCLGLPTAQESCSQALVQGWQVKASDGAQVWTYRTNGSGTQLRLENLQSPQVFLPAGIVEQVLADAAARSDLEPSQLKISKAEPKIWSDGCLGLGGLNALCTEALVPGWQVVAQSDRQRWVYRTNQSGSQVMLDQAGSQVVGQLIQPPQTIPPAELPPPLGTDSVFRLISYSGVNNRSTQTVLMADGRVLITKPNIQGVMETRPGRQVNPEMVSKFQQLLQEKRFARFNQLDYPAPVEAPAYATITLSTPDATLRFADIQQSQLSADVQDTLKAWNALLRRGKF